MDRTTDLMDVNVRAKFLEHIWVIHDSFRSRDLDGSWIVYRPALYFLQAYAKLFFDVSFENGNKLTPKHALSPPAMSLIVSFFQEYDHDSLSPTCITKVLDKIASSCLESDDRAIATLLLGLDSFTQWCYEVVTAKKIQISVKVIELLQSMIVKFYCEQVRFGKLSLLDLARFCDYLQLPLSPETNYRFVTGEAAVIGTPAVAQFHSYDLKELLFGRLHGLKYVDPKLKKVHLCLIHQGLTAIMVNDHTRVENNGNKKVQQDCRQVRTYIYPLLQHVRVFNRRNPGLPNSNLLSLILNFDEDGEEHAGMRYWKNYLYAPGERVADQIALKMLLNYDVKSRMLETRAFDAHKALKQHALQQWNASMKFQTLAELQQANAEHTGEPRLVTKYVAEETDDETGH